MIKKYLQNVDQLMIRYQMMKIMHQLAPIKLEIVLEFLNLKYSTIPNQNEMRLAELSKIINSKVNPKTPSLKKKIILNPEMNTYVHQQQLSTHLSITKLRNPQKKIKKLNKTQINYKVSNAALQKGFYNPKYIPPKAYMNFEICIEAIRAGFDKRTTLMIKNIPNKKTQLQVIQMINQNFEKKYDYFYLPIDFKYLQNVGYAFINFINYLDIIQFVDCYSGMRWASTSSKKCIELTYARTQGIKQLIKNHKKSLVYQTQNDPKLMPIILKN